METKAYKRRTTRIERQDDEVVRVCKKSTYSMNICIMAVNRGNVQLNRFSY